MLSDEVDQHELATGIASSAFSSSPIWFFEPVSSTERLKELWQIDQDAYQDHSLTFEEFLAWWQVYPPGSRVLIKNGQIQASIGLYPLSQTQALAFKSGTVPEAALELLTVEQCNQLPTSYWYASGIVVVRDRRGWSSPLRRLLRLGIQAWLTSPHVAYPVTVMALGQTSSGVNLLKHLRFMKERDRSETLDGLDLYSITLNSSTGFKL